MTEFANADGSFTKVQSARPVRVRVGGAWQPVDLHLSRTANRAFTPAAGAAVAFSGGGDRSLAELSGTGWSLRLGWNRPLPVPVISGASATYRGVLRGVDLVATATEDGFQTRLIVANREAAAQAGLRQVAFTLAATGAAVHASVDGRLTGVDPTGQVAFSAPAPTMWDAASDRTAGAQTHRQAAVGLRLRGDALSLQPDVAFLNDPRTRFPVAIDPSFAGGTLAWSTVDAAYPTVSYWNGANLGADSNGVVMVGYSAEGGDVARSFFRINTAPVAGKHILSATFQILEKWSWSCTAEPVQLWWTGGIAAGQTWNSQPGWNQEVAQVSAAHGNEAHGCADGNVEFNATSLVAKAAAGGWANATLGLRAADESDTSQWKRFDNNPTLAITYNSVPATPTNLTINGHPCASNTYVSTTTPTMRATVTDPDAGTQLSVNLYWAASGGSISESNKVTQTNVPTGSQAVKAVPAGKLVDGGSYFFQARSTDGTDTSPLSASCQFHVDSSRPDNPPVVTSTDYPAYSDTDSNVYGGVGRTGTFTFSSGGVADVASYQWGWADPPTTTVAAPSPGASVNMSLTPPPPGLLTSVYVRTVDRAGNLSNVTEYQFLIAGATDPAGEWNADEGSGSTAADAATGAHPATLGGGSSWTAGRTQGADHALGFDGSTGFAETTAPVVHTNQSFSVAAWVRLSTTSTGRWVTAVSQNDTAYSSFVLSYNGSAWAFATADSNKDSPVHYRLAAAGAVSANVWTHLVGVYDAGSQQMFLYVNGVLAGTLAGAHPFDSRSTLDIGRARVSSAWGDWFPGSVDDVRVWDRVVYPDEIRAIADAPSLMGEWDLDGDGSDSSGHSRTATVSAAGTSWNAGHDGSGGLKFDGSTGFAETGSPAMPTDQSFTVAAWVNLTTTSPGRWVTAVSQNGVTFSSFVLGYSGTAWAFAVHSADAVSPTLYRAIAPATLSATGWTHLAGVYDAGINETRLYVNGQQVASYEGAHPYASTKSVDIGRARVSGTWADWWPGGVDAVQMYLGVLSDRQIAALSNS